MKDKELAKENRVLDWDDEIECSITKMILQKIASNDKVYLDEYEITDLKVFMPIIVDLNTALIASKIILEAYEIYCKRYTPFAEMNNNFDNIDNSITKFKEYVQEKEKALLLS